MVVTQEGVQLLIAKYDREIVAPREEKIALVHNSQHQENQNRFRGIERQLDQWSFLMKILATGITAIVIGVLMLILRNFHVI